jgi:putative transposase
VYSWDITKLRGPLRGIWYDLYVMLDIFSRYVVGRTVARPRPPSWPPSSSTT